MVQIVNIIRNIDFALKNILRTHTTAISSQILFHLAKEYKRTGILPNQKLYSIDRVYRNEALDATHLAEFHQVEGVCIGKYTFADLKGILATFYKAMGIQQLYYKPTFNPYTEPSMEIFGYYEELGKWLEVGNSGVFRPEVIVPMGFPIDLRIIAWGLSAERPTMIRNKIKNIRELVGPRVKIET